MIEIGIRLEYVMMHVVPKFLKHKYGQIELWKCILQIEGRINSKFMIYSLFLSQFICCKHLLHITLATPVLCCFSYFFLLQIAECLTPSLSSIFCSSVIFLEMLITLLKQQYLLPSICQLFTITTFSSFISLCSSDQFQYTVYFMFIVSGLLILVRQLFQLVH